MIALQRKWLTAAVAVASLQTATIGWMVWDRIQLLKNGREIVLPIIPVDPRSLFRGDYVILSYDAQRVPISLITEEVDAAKPSVFFVTLSRKGDAWVPAGVTLKPTAAGPEQISVKARMRWGRWPRRGVADAAVVAPIAPPSTDGTVATPTRPVVREPAFDVRYGIESYFVPEGKGRPLEDTAREKKLAAVIAVDARGNAAIKALMIDGKRQVEEPLL
jgi:uncharacterized membrane-anchored protein